MISYSFPKQNMLEKFSAEFLWQRITELLRACIWIKNGVAPRHFAEYTAQLQFLTRGKSLQTYEMLCLNFSIPMKQCFVKLRHNMHFSK